MNLTDGAAVLTAANISGANSPTLSITLKLETTLADLSPVGEALVERWPLLRSALGEVVEGCTTVLSETAADLLGGGGHIVRVWGLPAEQRQKDARPLLACSAATLSGKALAEVTLAKGEDVAVAKVRLTLKAGHLAWGAVLMQELATQLHGECFVDIEAQQPELDVDPVTPTRRASAQVALVDAATNRILDVVEGGA